MGFQTSRQGDELCRLNCFRSHRRKEVDFPLSLRLLTSAATRLLQWLATIPVKKTSQSIAPGGSSVFHESPLNQRISETDCPEDFFAMRGR